jgi:hypothetical protein
MRRVLYVCALGAAVAIAMAVPAAANAAPGHHGGGGQHGGSGWHGGGGWRGGGWRGPAIGLGVLPYAAYNSCYQVRPVWRHGHRVWRRTYVC